MRLKKNTVFLERIGLSKSWLCFVYSVLGAAIVVIGFYGVLWGKSQERTKEESEDHTLESSSPVAPLLQNKRMEE